MTPKASFLEGTFWDKFWRPIRSRALLFTPGNRCPFLVGLRGDLGGIVGNNFGEVIASQKLPRDSCETVFVAKRLDAWQGPLGYAYTPAGQDYIHTSTFSELMFFVFQQCAN